MEDALPHAGASPAVFVGYFPADQSRAGEVIRSLAHDGVDALPVTLESTPAEGWKHEALEPIQSGDTFVMLSPPEDLDSSSLESLIRALDQRGVDVVPAVFSSRGIPKLLADRSAVDMQGEASADSLIARIEAGRSLDLLSLRPVDFENLVGDLLRAEGFQVVGPAFTPGRYISYDFIATEPKQGAEDPVRHYVEVKSYKRSRISVSSLYEIIGKLSAQPGENIHGMLFTNSQLTSVAEEFLQRLSSDPGNPRIQVFDGPDISYRLMAYPNLIRKYGRKGGEVQ